MVPSKLTVFRSPETTPRLEQSGSDSVSSWQWTLVSHTSDLSATIGNSKPMAMYYKYRHLYPLSAKNVTFLMTQIMNLLSLWGRSIWMRLVYIQEPSSQANFECLLCSRSQHTNSMLDSFLCLETQSSLALSLSVFLKFLSLSIPYFTG